MFPGVARAPSNETNPEAKPTPNSPGSRRKHTRKETNVQGEFKGGAPLFFQGGFFSILADLLCEFFGGSFPLSRREARGVIWGFFN